MKRSVLAMVMNTIWAFVLGFCIGAEFGHPSPAPVEPAKADIPEMTQLVFAPAVRTCGIVTAYTGEEGDVVPEIVKPDPPRYGFSDEEVYLLAQLLCGDKFEDGDGEYDFDFQDPENLNHYEIGKVLCVVMNRVRDDRFPNTVTDVVMARRQFAVMPANSKKTPSDIALHTVKDWCDAYDRYDPGIQCVPESHIYFTGNGTTNTTRP